MRKYKFKIENITEKLIEIEAENNKKAIQKLAEFMARKDKKNHANILGQDKYCYITLRQVCNEKRKILFKDDDEINRDIISNLFSAEEEFIEELAEKNKEENVKEHIEIVCEKCGNCILLDNIIHHLQS